jgi:hypothetical protein
MKCSERMDPRAARALAGHGCGHVQTYRRAASWASDAALHAAASMARPRSTKVNVVFRREFTSTLRTEKWNKAMAKLAMPKAVWDGVRGRMMKVLLEEHDTILKSFWAQKKKKSGGDELRGPRQCRPFEGDRADTVR